MALKMVGFSLLIFNSVNTADHKADYISQNSFRICP